MGDHLGMATEPTPSLRPELLSGRSLQPPRRPGWRGRLRERRGVVIAVVVVVALIGAVLGFRAAAEGAADQALDRRVDQLESLLGSAEPRDFLAFGESVQQPGSLAEAVRDEDGFVNLRATAGLTFIRFQPSGWWSGFTERCLVALVRDDGVTIEVPRRNCVRVTPPES
jgi:hypothetical protein